MACTLAVSVEAPPLYQCPLSSSVTTATAVATTDDHCGPLAIAARVLTKVERSLLRALAFVLHQLHRSHARYCATSVLQWYLLLQSQLPGFAVDSLDKAVTSVSALADTSFSDFWLSLLRPDADSEHGSDSTRGSLRTQTVESLGLESQAQTAKSEQEQQQQQHLLVRLYSYITCSILGFSMDQTSASDVKQRRNLTPCTSPVNAAAGSSHRQRRRRFPSVDDTNSEDSCWSRRGWQDDEDFALADSEDDRLEPGWAIEYMQQELALPTAMKRRMASMMHSAVPLNLFRATVVYANSEDDTYQEADDDDGQSSSCASDRGRGGFVGAVTPGSLPPTPNTRDLQARHMHHYTVFVLDHTTHALQLLETRCFE